MGFVVSEAGIDGRVWEVLGQQSIDFGQHVHISLFGGGPHIVGRHISGVIYPIDLVVLPDVIIMALNRVRTLLYSYAQLLQQSPSPAGMWVRMWTDSPASSADSRVSWNHWSCSWIKEAL